MGWISCISVCCCFSRNFSVSFQLFCCFFFFFGFRLVYLSCCIYNRTKTHITTETTNKSFEKNIQTENNKNTLFPSRNLRDIYSRSGRGLDILYVCLYIYIYIMFFSKLFYFLFFLLFFSVFA